MDLYSSAARFDGIAAAADLDALLSHDDFEPAVDVDTVALDVLPDAIADAARLTEALVALQAHLAAGGDADTAAGLKLDIRLASEALMAHAAEMGA